MHLGIVLLDWQTGVVVLIRRIQPIVEISPSLFCGFGDVICLDPGILWEVFQVYETGDPLLRTVQSLCEQSRSLVCVAGSESDL